MPTFTGYNVDGGYAEYALATALGCSALALRRIWPSPSCMTGSAKSMSRRAAPHRQLAASLGATWVGSELDRPPVEFDRAVTFAP